MIDLGIDLETAGLVLSAVIALIMSLKNNMVLNGRAKTVEIVTELVGVMPDVSALLKKSVEAQADDKITAEELASIVDEAKKIEAHIIAIKNKLVTV